jgi:transcriptional regulator GlxA family with amidase domain
VGELVKGLGRIAKRLPLMLVTGSACAGQGRSDVTRQVQILAFDGMEVLDYAGPYEVFNVAGEQTSPAAFTVQAVGVSPRPVGRGGFAVVPVCQYSEAPPGDIVVIPGGRGTRPLMRDQALLAWIAGRAAGAELVMTVCTGALLAAAAGLLDGLAATTHHGAFGELERAAPTATVVRSVRFVRSAPRLYTSAGVSAGVDLALHIVEELAGGEARAATEAEMEWMWDRDQALLS